MAERDLERRLRDQLRRAGCLPLKFVSPGYTGVPDRIILIPGGQIVFVEMKAPGEKERPRQVYLQGLLRRMGFTVFSAVDSREKIDSVVEYCREAMHAKV